MPEKSIPLLLYGMVSYPFLAFSLRFPFYV
jgi:hypothetical protein